MISSFRAVLMDGFVQIRQEHHRALDQRINAPTASTLMWLRTSLCKQSKSTKLSAKQAGLLGDSGQMSEMWIFHGGIVDVPRFPSNGSNHVISPSHQAG
jgi:hypothetical protein